MTAINAPQERKFTINNKQFLSYVWPVRSRAFKFLPIIGNAFVVPISFLDGTTEGIASAATMFFENLRQPENEQLIDIILDGVHIKKNGGYVPLDLDSDFDDIDEMFQVAAEILQQNYGKLLSGKGSRSLLGVLVPLTEAAKTSAPQNPA